MSMHYRPENQIVRSSAKPKMIRRRKLGDGSTTESIIKPALEKIWSPMADVEPKIQV